jgi:hypothetical protein
LRGDGATELGQPRGRTVVRVAGLERLGGGATDERRRVEVGFTDPRWTMLRPCASSALPRASISNDAAVLRWPIRSANLMRTPLDMRATPTRETRSSHPLDRPRGRPRADARSTRGPCEPQADLPVGHRQHDLHTRAESLARRRAQNPPIPAGLRQIQRLTPPHGPDHVRDRHATVAGQVMFHPHHHRTSHGLARERACAPQLMSQREPRHRCRPAPFGPQTLSGAEGTCARRGFATCSMLLFEPVRDMAMVSQVMGHFKRGTCTDVTRCPTPERDASRAPNGVGRDTEREADRMRRSAP